mgnify:CR=1 FL=1
MSISIADITKRAYANGDWNELAPDGFIKDPAGFNIPDHGWTGYVDAVSVKFGSTAKGNPSISIQLRDLDTETKFWGNLYYSDNDNSNMIVANQLSQWGVTEEKLEEIVESFEDPNDGIAQVIMECESVFCRVTHQVSDDTERIFVKTSFTSNNPLEGVEGEEVVEFD